MENIFISLDDGALPGAPNAILTESLADDQWAWYSIKPGLYLLILDFGVNKPLACRINLSMPCMILAYPFSSQAGQPTQAGTIPSGAHCVSKMSDHVHLEFSSEIRRLC